VKALYFFFFLLLSSFLGAQDYIEGLLWISTDPVDPLEIEQMPLDDRALVLAMKEEALSYFSAMVYGMDFRYVPWDIARGIEEELEVSLSHWIPADDPGLKVVESWWDRRENRFWARFRYELEDHSRLWVQSWPTSSQLNLGGSSLSEMGGRWEMREQSVHRAIREGVRDYLRAREFNRPREITGRLALRAFPSFRGEAGRYNAQVSFFFQFTNVRPQFR